MTQHPQPSVLTVLWFDTETFFVALLGVLWCVGTGALLAYNPGLEPSFRNLLLILAIAVCGFVAAMATIRIRSIRQTFATGRRTMGQVLKIDVDDDRQNNLAVIGYEVNGKQYTIKPAIALLARFDPKPGDSVELVVHPVLPKRAFVIAQYV